MIQKILIVEDEMIIATSIRLYLEELHYEVINTLDDFSEIRFQIKSNPPDMVLLDINLKNSYDGTNIATHLNSMNIPFIFLTSYSDDKTVAKAMETSPLGYILKPITKDALFVHLELVKKKLAQEIFVIKDSGTTYHINYKDMIYLHAEGNYSTIYTKEKKIVLRKSLVTLEPTLSSNFMRIHKSYIINRQYIKTITDDEIFLKDNSILPLSRHYKKTNALH